MTRFRLAAALALVAALFPPAGAVASDGNGCPAAPNSTAWTGNASCKFVFRGTPLTIRGDSVASSARVHVFVTIEGNPEIPPLFECTATGASFASCSKDYPDATTDHTIPNQVSTIFLRCNVEGAGHGTYYCQAAKG